MFAEVPQEVFASVSHCEVGAAGGAVPAEGAEGLVSDLVINGEAEEVEVLVAVGTISMD